MEFRPVLRQIYICLGLAEALNLAVLVIKTSMGSAVVDDGGACIMFGAALLPPVDRPALVASCGGGCGGYVHTGLGLWTAALRQPAGAAGSNFPRGVQLPVCYEIPSRPQGIWPPMSQVDFVNAGFVTYAADPW